MMEIVFFACFSFLCAFTVLKQVAQTIVVVKTDLALSVERAVQVGDNGEVRVSSAWVSALGDDTKMSTNPLNKDQM
jgi:hypothetical protein